VEGVPALTDRNGANVVVDALGRPETFAQASYARDLAGTVVLVGLPTPERALSCPCSTCSAAAARPRRRGTAIDCPPATSHARRPAPAGPAAAGEVRFRDHRVNDVEAAFHKMHKGEVLRSVVVF
jgi:S-(hydroxymethyl)mycothiol dehydrogenase